MPKIHELMTSPAKWTKGFFGRTASGEAIMAREQLDRACRCCALGWIHKVYGLGKKAERVKDKIYKRIGEGCITDWNDRSTFREVHAVFKELDL